MVKRFNFSLLIIFVSLSASFLFSKEPNDEKYIGRNSTPPVLIQWNLGDHPASIQADKAWDYTTGSSDVVVAVVDTGFDINHEDFQLNLPDRKTIFTDKAYNSFYKQDGNLEIVKPPSNWITLSLISSGDLIRLTAYKIMLIVPDLSPYKEEFVEWLYDVANLCDLLDLLKNWQQVPIPLPETDYQRHGTCVSGIIGAVTNNGKGISGIAGGWYDTDPNKCIPGVKIMPIKFWPDVGHISLIYPLDLYDEILPALARGIRWAAENGADVINGSLIAGLEELSRWFPALITDIYMGYVLINGVQIKLYPDTVRDALQYAHRKGCFISVPAGNSIATISAPGRDKTVICTAVGDKGKKLGYKGSDMGSSYGPEVAVIAPGDGCKTTDLTSGEYKPLWGNDFNTYHDFGYNSAATPHTSGVAALVYSLLPKELRYINPDEPDLTKRVHRDGIQEIVRHIITRSSDKNIGQPEDGWRQAYWGYSQVGVPDKMKSDPYHGEGWLNAKSAVEMARDYEWRCDVKEIHLRSDFIIPDDVEIIIEDGNFTLKLNKEEWKEATITWNDLTYTPTSYYWVETEYNQPGIKEVKEDWDGHSLTVKVKLESWATMPAKFDRKYYLISCKKAFPYTNIVEKDKTGPSEVILTEPEKNKTINTTRPKFRWSSSIDTGEGITGTGISHYEIELTTVVPENPTESYKQPAGAILVKDFNDGEALSGGWKNCRGNATLSVDNGKLLFIPNSIDGNDVYAPRYNSHIYKEGVGTDVEMRCKIMIPGSELVTEDEWSGSGIFVHGTGEYPYKWALCIRYKRVDPSRPNIYQLAILEEWSGGGWLADEVAGGRPAQASAKASVEILPDTNYFMKLKVTGKILYGKVWKEGTDEPGWLVVGHCMDDYLVDKEAVGVFSHSKKVIFDDIVVKRVDMIYSDDFNDGDADGWRQSGNWEVENGEYVSRSAGGGNVVYMSCTGDYSWDNYEASVRVNPKTDGWVSNLLVRETDVRNYYRIQTQRDKITVSKWVNNKAEYSVTYNCIDKIGESEIRKEQWHTLRIRCVKEITIIGIQIKTIYYA